MNESNLKANKKLLPPLIIISTGALIVFTLCSLAHYDGMKKILPILLFVYYLAINIALNHIKPLHEKPILRRFAQGLLTLAAIIVLLLI